LPPFLAHNGCNFNFLRAAAKNIHQAVGVK